MSFKALLAVLTVCLSLAAPCYELPDLGASGTRGMTVERERRIGEYFMRLARGNLPVAADPALEEYLNYVGSRLLMRAGGVNFPFEFFIVNNRELNASAFLGGKVQVYAGLFHYSDTEDEFASVLAHEITHVTQRHIARFIESQLNAQSLTLTGIIGSIAMAVINPMAGMAALSSTMGASAQARVNFTRDNEYEADRMGIDLLYAAGFNPRGMSDMFKKLATQQGNINPAFSMLLDHPLSDIRTAEAENRARLYPARDNSRNPDFMLAKARVDVRYMGYDPERLRERLDVNPDQIDRTYRSYALALIAFEQRRFEQARSHLSELGMPDSIFVLDLLTDIEIESGRADAAAARLRQMHRRRPGNAAIAVNLAQALLRASAPREAQAVLLDCQREHPDNPLLSDLLTEAYRASGERCLALQSGAHSFGLRANYNRAQGMYGEALNVCGGDEREIVRARMARLSKQRAFDEELNRQGK